MTPVRAFAILLAALVLPIGPAPVVAAPVPYGQLVRSETPRRAPPRRPKPRPRPVATSGAVAAGALGTAVVAAGAVPPAAALQGPATHAAATRPDRPTAAPPLPTFTSPGPVVARPPATPPAPPPHAAPAELPVATTVPSAAPAGARLAPGAALPPAELESFVDGAVREAMASDHVAGVAVAVVQHGQVLLERGWGLARRSPARPVDPRTTLFRLGSVSKVFTWIEVLRAVEAGRLRLDAPVNALLPPALRVPQDGFRQPIRLRDLMTHEAGFESREFGRLFHDDPGEVRALDDVLAHERPRRVRAPGELGAYSSYGAALAGRMAAPAGFEDAVEADLLRPAGLASTTFREPDTGRDGLPAPMPEALAARLAEGFTWGRDGFARQPFGFASGLAPALSASSTADDMARLMLALLGGGRAGGSGAPLWGPRTDAALRTPLTPGWAHGLMVYALPGGFRGFGHEGATPAFRAKLVTAPQLGLGVFVVANSDTGERLVHGLPELIVRRSYAGPAALAAPAPLADPGAFAGLYVSTRRAYHGLEGFVGRLTRLYTVRAEPGGALAVWGPEGGRRWLATTERGRFVAADDTGEPLGFRLGAAGRATAFLDPGGMWGAERVDLLHRPEVLAAVAAAAQIAALLTLAGLLVRDAREYRQSGRQVTASRLQSFAAGLWLVALAAFTVFTLTGANAATLQKTWPNPWLVGASVAALGAALLTLAQLTQLPGVWRDERRLNGWSAGRKLRHTLTVLAFGAFAFVLLGWGALEPWSG